MSGSEATIVLVDDEPAILMTVGDRLQSHGYSVTRVASAEECLRVLKTMNPDLLIVDLGMPGKGGLELINEICGPDRRLAYPVLVLTAHAGMKEFFRDTPVDGFVLKTDGPDVLIREVKRIIALRRTAPAP